MSYSISVRLQVKILMLRWRDSETDQMPYCAHSATGPTMSQDKWQSQYPVYFFSGSTIKSQIERTFTRSGLFVPNYDQFFLIMT